MHILIVTSNLLKRAIAECGMYKSVSFFLFYSLAHQSTNLNHDVLTVSKSANKKHNTFEISGYCHDTSSASAKHITTFWYLWLT